MNSWMVGAIIALVVGGAGWAVGLGNLAKIARTVLGIVSDWFGRAREWMRTPGNPLRAACAVLALACVAVGLQSWQRGSIIQHERAKYALEQERAKFRIEALSSSVRERDQAISRFITLAENNRRLLEIAAAQAEAALSDAERARRRAADSEQKFQEAFDNRPPECEAALRAMAQACPALSDY